MVEVAENGKIKFPLDLFTSGEWFTSDELITTIADAQPDPTEGEEEVPKLQALAKGFMFQAGKAMAGQEPFYLETHLIGENQYAVSGNKNGVMTRADVKALRKALKSLLNQEKEDYEVESGETTQMQDDGSYDDYYDEEPIF